MASRAVAEYESGQGILTAALYPVAYLAGRSFLSFEDQQTALQLAAQTGTGISAKQLAAQTALYRVGAPIVELLGVNL